MGEWLGMEIKEMRFLSRFANRFVNKKYKETAREERERKKTVYEENISIHWERHRQEV